MDDDFSNGAVTATAPLPATKSGKRKRSRKVSIAESSPKPKGTPKPKGNPRPPAKPKPAASPLPAESRAISAVASPKELRRSGDYINLLRRPVHRIRNIAEPKRAAVALMLLDNGPMNVGDIAKATLSTQPATSHHLALLRHAGVVDVDRQGKNNYYYLSADGTKLAEFLADFATAE